MTACTSRPARGAWVEMPSPRPAQWQPRSRPARGAWVEILCVFDAVRDFAGRAPQGARGLKYESAGCCGLPVYGRAPQGARGLKFRLPFTRGRLSISRAPQGARGLKYNHIKTKVNATGRAPQGARGLKSKLCVCRPFSRRSRPARGAWVEIPTPTGCATGDPTSRPARGAWIETLPGFRYRIPPQKGSLCRSAETSFSFSIFTCRSSGLRSRHFSRPGGPWRGAGLHRSAGSARSRAHAGT